VNIAYKEHKDLHIFEYNSLEFLSYCKLFIP